MFKLDLEKAEEAEIKLPTFIGLLRKQDNSRQISFSALLTMPNSLMVWFTINWKILKERGIPDHLTLEKYLCRSGSKLELDMEQ